MLCISARTVRLWAECAILAGIRIGKQWRFRRSEIEALLETPAPTAKPNPTAAKSRWGTSKRR
jgi:hypothetical protein